MKLGTVSNLITVPEGTDPILGRIERAADLGLSVLGITLRDTWQDHDYLRRVSGLAQSRGIELRIGAGGNFYLQGPEGEAEMARVAEMLLAIARHTNIRFASTPAGPMLTTHRFTSGPPLPERLSLLALNLGALADAVAGVGFTVCLENHCDYRGHEIATIITEANRPNLRVQIDTGNAFSVFEDPIDCARALAPYTVSCHLKDIHVTPFASAPCRGSRAVAVPLGEGHVDNAAICQILQDQAPDPASLALMCEPFYLPDDADPDQFLATSITWSRIHLAPFLA
jgi:sugar phosphate isomerase/epimerase